MNYIALNAVTILIAACAGLVVGVGYEALPVRHSQQMRGFPIGLLATAFIAEYWLVAILAGALIVAPQQANPWVMALASAAVIWVGFLVPVLVVTHASRGFSASAMILDCGHWLVVMMVQAAVLQGLGLVHPHS